MMIGTHGRIYNDSGVYVGMIMQDLNGYFYRLYRTPGKGHINHGDHNPKYDSIHFSSIDELKAVLLLK